MAVCPEEARLMNSTVRSRLAAFSALALLMASTRLNHFGAIPDASWAVFFLAGFYLRDSLRWAFPALMAIAVLVDWVVISNAGIPFWSHYCVSPGYWFLLPAHFSLWAAGTVLRRHAEPLTVYTAGVFALTLLGGVALCHLFAQGGFYWFSSSVAEPTVAGWAKNYGDWFLPYLQTTTIYTGLAAIIHVAWVKLVRGAPAAGTALR
jgi:hypothetical protein